jgi:hypothetical protein
MNIAEAQKYKKKFIVFAIITIAVVIADAILLTMYYDHLKELIR